MSMQNGRKDATIHAPIATASLDELARLPKLDAIAPPTPQEIIQAQAAQIRELKDEVEKHKVASGTLGAACTQLVRIVNDERGAPLETEVVIEREWIEKLDGSVALSETGDRGLLVRFTERVKNPGWEGR